jgi:CRISPR-associated protein Cmr1
MTPMEIELRTLTPLWTGGVDPVCDRVHETGLIGSLRWWYEALVRGLGGYACDPTGNDRCPDQDGRWCAACELFGCTGWARKFRLQVLDRNGAPIRDALERNMDFRLRFVELRPMNDAEKWLLAKAVEIAAKYGALGGKTTLKPQKNVRGPNDTLKKFPRAKPGDDMGLVSWQNGNGVPDLQIADALAFVCKAEWRHVHQAEFPDLRWFFFTPNQFLWRRQLNTLMGRSPDGRRVIKRGQQVEDWLRGDIGISKKIFSFRAGGGRVWGYARDKRMRDEIITQIRKELGNGRYTIKTGEEVLNEL